MENFWDFSVWGSFNVIAILLISLLVANALKRLIKPLGNPSSPPRCWAASCCSSSPPFTRA